MVELLKIFTRDGVCCAVVLNKTQDDIVSQPLTEEDRTLVSVDEGGRVNLDFLFGGVEMDPAMEGSSMINGVTRHLYGETQSRFYTYGVSVSLKAAPRYDVEALT